MVLSLSFNFVIVAVVPCEWVWNLSLTSGKGDRNKSMYTDVLHQAIANAKETWLWKDMSAISFTHFQSEIAFTFALTFIPFEHSLKRKKFNTKFENISSF